MIGVRELRKISLAVGMPARRAVNRAKNRKAGE